MSKSLMGFLALLAVAVGAHAAPLVYEVHALPAVPVSDDEPNHVTGHAIDDAGRALISVTTDDYQFWNGELCRKDKCSRIPPKQQSARWFGLSSSGFMAGQILHGQRSQPALRNPDGSIRTLAWEGSASAVNKTGVVIGDEGNGRAYYFDTRLHRLPDLGGGSTAATDINDNGVIVGQSTLTNGKTHAFNFRDGTITDLGALEGGSWSSALAVNAHGVAVGYSNEAGKSHSVAVKFEGGAVVRLGSLGGGTSYANGINTLAVIVGSAAVSKSSSHAFLHDGTTMIDLNDAISPQDQAEWYLYSAEDVNDAGQILVSAQRRSDWKSVPVLLTPKP